MKNLFTAWLFFNVLLILTVSLHAQATVTFGIKSNGLSFTEVQSYFPLFEERHVNLYLEIREHQIGSTDLKNLLTDAQERNIQVTLWPLLSLEQGPWANENNASIYVALVTKLMDWLEQVEVHPEWLAVNMENSQAQMDIIGEYFYNETYEELCTFLLGNVDKENFAQAVHTYQELVQDAHRRGYKVMVTTYPFMMDDFSDADADLQDIANVPLQGIDWDALTFTTYRTAYSEDFGTTFNSSFVYDYGKTARRLFGDKARLSLGIIGETEHGPGYTSPEDLALDIAAAKASGIREIDVFHLAGMIKKGGPALWLDVLDVPAQKPLPDPKVTAGRAVAKTADIAFDWRLIQLALKKFLATD